jgi:hypothetical protein
MTADKIDWLDAGLQGQHWPGTDEAFDLCEGLSRRFRQDRAPMPVVVLHATPPETAPGSPQPPAPVLVSAYQVSQVSGIVEVLHGIYQKGGLPCKGLPPDEFSAASVFPRPAGDLGKYEDALAMVRTLSTTGAWDHYDESHYRPYTFPRSQMLAAIEEAVANPPDGGRPDYKKVLRSLGKLRWMPGEKGESATLRVLASLVSPATLIGALVLTALARVITAASLMWVLVSLAAAIVAVGLILVAQQNFAPLSWLGSASQWFTTTTFMGPASDVPGVGEVRPRWPRRTWRAREARAGLVVRQLITAYYEPHSGDSADARIAQERALQFCLLLRVHALLEDLRANHHPWHPDLRRRKRTCPPMVFLPNADNVPGSLELLQAVSDVRSRRSEMDPLLIVASSQSLPTLPRSAPTQRRLGPYEQWASRLLVEQSPSLGSHWPWVLLFPISTDLLRGQSTTRLDQPRARWSVWNLWSRWSLALAIAGLAAAGIFANNHYASAYCGGGLFSYDPNLVWVGSECIGIDTTDTTEFVPADGGVTLSDDASEAVAPPAATGSRINLADLESLIFQQNQTATQSGAYVTLVYAGALTGPPGTTDAVSAAEELAGVYAWQYATNTSDPNIEVRIDIANAGDDLAHQDIMAGKIVAAAADPSIVGVIGLGGDIKTSDKVVQELAKADLVVVDTTNSDDVFPEKYWNYFGLSATNSEEANALQQYTKDAVNGYAVVFQRQPLVRDPYTEEQAKAAVLMLRRADFRLIGNGALPWTVNSNNRSELVNSPAVARVCRSHDYPSVIYLAGRSEDLAKVELTLRQDADCFARHVIVLSGDDLTSIDYHATSQSSIPTQMTLYYAAQTDPAYVPPDGQDNGSDLNTYLQAALGRTSTLFYKDPIFADGTIALAFDAADALYTAATANDPGTQQQLAGRASIAPNLRCTKITHGATGTIGFANVQHGLNIFEVPPTTDNGQQTVRHVHGVATMPGSCKPNVAP